jgi:hypothetical protein
MRKQENRTTAVVDIAPGMSACLHCGQPFPAKHTGRPPKFCGDRCRSAYHRGQRRHERHKVTCDQCGADVWPQQRGRLPKRCPSCSRKVSVSRVWLYRNRRRNGWRHCEECDEFYHPEINGPTEVTCTGCGESFMPPTCHRGGPPVARLFSGLCPECEGAGIRPESAPEPESVPEERTCSLCGDPFQPAAPDERSCAECREWAADQAAASQAGQSQ